MFIGIIIIDIVFIGLMFIGKGAGQLLEARYHPLSAIMGLQTFGIGIVGTTFLWSLSVFGHVASGRTFIEG